MIPHTNVPAFLPFSYGVMLVISCGVASASAQPVSMGSIPVLKTASIQTQPRPESVNPDNLDDQAKNATQSTGQPTQGVGVRMGYHKDFRRLALVYETPAFWQYQFENGWGRVDLNAELGLAYWDAIRGKPDAMWQLSAIPVLRWWPKDTFYLEAGVGPTVLSRSEFAGHDLGTRFQFGSHFGVGFLIQKAHRIGVRYSHFSNANIKKPNPGLDVWQLSYSYEF